MIMYSCVWYYYSTWTICSLLSVLPNRTSGWCTSVVVPEIWSLHKIELEVEIIWILRVPKILKITHYDYSARFRIARRIWTDPSILYCYNPQSTKGSSNLWSSHSWGQSRDGSLQAQVLLGLICQILLLTLAFCFTILRFTYRMYNFELVLNKVKWIKLSADHKRWTDMYNKFSFSYYVREDQEKYV